MRARQSGLVAVFSLGALLITAGPGSAQDSVNVGPPRVTASLMGQPTPPRQSGRYFIEFRARAAQSYGHAYVLYGTLGPRGKIAKAEVAGIHPATESVVPWMIGHLVPVPSETGASDGDNEDIYTTARWRIMLSDAEYRKTVASIREIQAKHPAWHAVFYNCVSFVKDVATAMNLKTPLTNITYPEVFINNPREMSASRDAVAVTSIPYGQWGMEPPPEVSPNPPRAKSAAKPTAPRSGTAAPRAAAPEATIAPQLTPQ